MIGSNKAEIKRAISVLKDLLHGDFESRITNIRATGEVRELLELINDFADRSDSYVRETQAAMLYVSQNKYYRKMIERGMIGGFAVGARNINKALDAMEFKVSEFSRVTSDFEQKIGQVVSTVSKASEDLNQSAQSMEGIATDASSQISNVAVAIDDASSNVETVAAASEQLSASISEIGIQVGHASKVAESASGVSQNVSAEVNNLKEAASLIVNAVNIINDIADKTKMLALNATIEAARAGEAGKGFAVVANEVKSLASQTNDATQQIANYVNKIQSATELTVSGMDKIKDMVDQMNTSNGTISTAIHQQSEATTEIARSIEQVSNGTKEVRENIQIVSSASSETTSEAGYVNQAASKLSDQSHDLEFAVTGFLQKVKQVI